MSYRNVALVVGVALGGAGLAGVCAARAGRLEAQAAWLLVRGTAEGAEYASSFDGRYVDQELATYQERREVLERAFLWHRGATGLVMAAVLLALAGYALFLLERLQERRPGALASAPAPAPAPPQRSRSVVQVR